MRSMFALTSQAVDIFVDIRYQEKFLLAYISVSRLGRPLFVWHKFSIYNALEITTFIKNKVGLFTPGQSCKAKLYFVTVVRRCKNLNRFCTSTSWTEEWMPLYSILTHLREVKVSGLVYEGLTRSGIAFCIDALRPFKTNLMMCAPVPAKQNNNLLRGCLVIIVTRSKYRKFLWISHFRCLS